MKLAMLMIAIAVLLIPAASEIDGSIQKVDWSTAGISGACPIDYRPSVTIKNTGDEKARFYVTISVMDQRGKERQSSCWTTDEIEPGNSATVWPYSIKLMARYNRVKVSLYANYCIPSHLLDSEPHMVELKDCKNQLK